MASPIPCPPPLPLLGNLRDIDVANPIGSFFDLSKTYGPIFKLNLGGENKIFINNYDLLNEVCDEKRFTKMVSGALGQLRNAIHDGLFTADIEEPNWGLAHRILMPAFGHLSIRAMYPEMHDITCQMALKWARFGPQTPIHVTSDFTRLALDSIGLCAMNTRFNSFYTERLHPFVTAMNDILNECGRRSSRPNFMTWLARGAQQKWDNDYSLLHSVANDVIAERRNTPTGKKDLLNALINGRDPKTGEALSDESVRNNMVTFLIAGHETTASLLSFIFMYLMLHMDKYRLVQQEVDTIIGKDPVSVDHLSKLPYVNAVVRETLRLQPIGAALLLRPTSAGPTTLGGKYLVEPGQTIVALLQQVQRDPAIFGEDADEFRPERMTDGFFNKLPRNCYKPFGNGMRGCIGRPFALQEILLAVALLFQVFDFKLVDPDYQITVKQTLAMKPDNLFMYAQLRPGIDLDRLETSLRHGGHNSKTGEGVETSARDTQKEQRRSLYIFYGSNTGTCEELAGKLAISASHHGYHAQIGTLDSSRNQIPKAAPVIFITASYNGEPPDNAAQFISWLESKESAAPDLEGVDYAVFGCGHRDWQATFGRIPTLTDTLLHKQGANRIALKGFADVAEGNIFNDFDEWEDTVLWPGIEARFGFAESITDASTSGADLDFKLSRDLRPLTLRHNVKEARVLSNTLLTAEDVPHKRDMELRLPEGMTYRTGDYLNILAVNNPGQVKRVLRRFSLPEDAVVEVYLLRKHMTSLPIGRSVAVTELLSAYVELGQPVTTRNIKVVTESMPDPSLRAEVLDVLESDSIPITDGIDGRITSASLTPRLSLLDLLDLYPTANITFPTFLSMLPPFHIRQYSISSSPLRNPGVATLTWAVLGRQPHLSATVPQSHNSLTDGTLHEDETLITGDRVDRTTAKPMSYQSQDSHHKICFQGGVASTYLSGLTPGDIIHVSVSPASKHFELPPPSTPIIMIAAGTGVAPFRAFVQERAHVLSSSNPGAIELAPALLYLGSRYSDKDALYVGELGAWERMGAVSVRRTYSREKQKSGGCGYVQERMWQERDEVMKWWKRGARVFVCGKAGLGEGSREVLKRAWGEQGLGSEEEWDGEEWLGGKRFVVDVFT